jgi:predicted MFS family arabinose efflux permease
MWSFALSALLAITALLDHARIDTWSLGAYALVYFGIGGFTAASYAMFMHNASGPLAATVFSAFMGLTNGCEALAAWLGGMLHRERGYPLAIALPAVISLGALLLLRGVRGRRR